MTCKHVNIGEIKLTFTSIRETTIDVNEYNSKCTRVVLHIYERFTWYLITIIVPCCRPTRRLSLQWARNPYSADAVYTAFVAVRPMW